MDQSNLNTGSQFSQPIRQIISLLIVSGLSGLGVVIAAPSVWPVFASNIYLMQILAKHLVQQLQHPNRSNPPLLIEK